MTSDAERKVALITGAAGDIGHAAAQKLARAGYQVAMADMAAEALAKAAADVPGALPCVTDLARPEAPAQLISQVLAQCGRLDLLVNNAAVVTPGLALAELPVAEWQKALDVNLTAPFLLCQAAIPAMLAVGGGVILNVASQLGHVAGHGRAAYSASKAGLLALTRALALEYGPQGIRAASLSPGTILTSRVTTRYGDAAAAEAALKSKHPIGRLGTASEIADGIVFLASPQAGFINGTDLLMDGGYTVQ